MFNRLCESIESHIGGCVNPQYENDTAPNLIDHFDPAVLGQGVIRL